MWDIFRAHVKGQYRHGYKQSSCRYKSWVRTRFKCCGQFQARHLQCNVPSTIKSKILNYKSQSGQGQRKIYQSKKRAKELLRRNAPRQCGIYIVLLSSSPTNLYFSQSFKLFSKDNMLNWLDCEVQFKKGNWINLWFSLWLEFYASPKNLNRRNLVTF